MLAAPLKLLSITPARLRLQEELSMPFSCTPSPNAPLTYPPALRRTQNAAASGAARLLVGSYDGTNNADVAAGEYFSINLQEPPYSLRQPAEVLDEQSGGKRLLLYELGGLQGEDWDGMRARCSAEKDKGGG